MFCFVDHQTDSGADQVKYSLVIMDLSLMMNRLGPKADLPSPYSEEVKIAFIYIFTHPYVFIY
jgi:hypothetical protein